MAHRTFHLQRRGFSLIELMGVIAIMGLLLAIGIPLFNQAQVGGRGNTANNTLEGVLAAANTNATQTSVATARGEHFIIGYNELPAADRQNIALIGVEDAGESAVGAEGVSLAAGTDYNFIVGLQNIDGVVRGGCFFLPEDLRSNEHGVYLPHGFEATDTLAFDDGKAIISEGQFVDILAADCVNANDVDPLEGIFAGGQANFVNDAGTDQNLEFHQP